MSPIVGSVRGAVAATRDHGERPRRAAAGSPLRRVLAGLLLPLSLVPVVLLAPSLARAPMTLVRHAEQALAPARARPRAVRREPAGPAYYLDGPARVEIDVLEEAGAATPKLGYSPLAEPEAAVRAAIGSAAADPPSVLVARGRETTTASGQPLR
jgi:hypothetical protein